MSTNGGTAIAAQKKTAKKSEEKTATRLLIMPVAVKRIAFGIKSRGDSPMVQHAWSEKALGMMRMTAAERAKVKKIERKPEEEALACQYFTDDGETGFLAMAFKSSLIAAAHNNLGLPKTLLRKGMFIICTDKNGILRMDADDPIVREDMVRVGKGQTDIRYRLEFQNWSARIEMDIDSELLNTQDILNLVSRAGFGVGIGEWRPERGGEWGRYEVDTSVAVEERVS